MVDLANTPSGWRIIRLGDITAVGQGGTPRKKRSDYWGGSIPFVTGADLRDFRITREHARSFLTEAGLYSGQTAVCKPGQLLLATRTRVGLVGVATEIMGASQDITLLTPKPTVIANFLARALIQNARSFQRISRGTTIQGITQRDVASFPILLPPQNEQEAIAAVLDAIEETIKRTEAVISATERLRGALLQELLSRGVRGWHTEWRAIAGVGTFPSSWRIARLRDLATLQRGADLPVQDRETGMIPVYGSNGILGSHTRALRLGPGVITGRSGSIGNVYFSNRPYWPLNTTLYVRDFHGNNPRFVYWRLLAARLSRFAASTGVPSLNRNFVHPLPLAIPPTREQKMIGLILDTAHETVNRQRCCVNRLHCFKNSLADSLLTGTVRTLEASKEL